MRFEDFKNEMNHHRTQEMALAKVGEREWVTPELMLITVRVGVFDDDTQCLLSVSKWRKQEGAVSIVAGREIKGGYFDYQHEGVSRMCTAVDLERLAFARLQVERWIEGSIPRLPEQLWT